MTVQELINDLQKVDDKGQEVIMGIIHLGQIHFESQYVMRRLVPHRIVGLNYFFIDPVL